MISIVLYGRNDNYGYNLHKRAALSFNCMAEILRDEDDEIIFVDYNTPNDFPTFPEAIQDTLSEKARMRLRVLRVRPHVHRRFSSKTRLVALEPISRNVAVRRSNPRNRWILSTNTDMIFVPQLRSSLSDVVRDLPIGFYHAPRIEIPETLWEGLDRRNAPEAIETVREWGSALHINEIVLGSPVILYDGPGDFQLVQRADLFKIHGFDEEMLLGWHVDSNIAKRLTMLHGKVGDLGKEIYGYHCDHTRQVTPAHSYSRTENDWRRFVENLDRPDIPGQAEGWGCADDAIEEIRLNGQTASAYVTALKTQIGERQSTPPIVAYVGENYNKVGYDPRHVLPYLADMFVCSERRTNVAWFGTRSDLFALFAGFWKDLHFTGDLLIDEALVSQHGLASAPQALQVNFQTLLSRADVFVFDFKPVAEGDNTIAGIPYEVATAMNRALLQIVEAEQQRWHEGTPPRQVIAVNVINNDFESGAMTHLSVALTPFSTRMRHGFVLPPAKGEIDWTSRLRPGRAGMQDGNLIRSRKALGAVTEGPFRHLNPGSYRIRLKLSGPSSRSDAGQAIAVLEILSQRDLLAHRLVTPSDIAKGEIELDFDVSTDQSNKPGFSMQTIVRTLAPIDLEISSLGCERLSHLSIESGRIRSLEVKEWLPLLWTGSHAMRKNGQIYYSSRKPGIVFHGPYWRLPKGRYQAVFKMEAQAPWLVGNALARAYAKSILSTLASLRRWIARVPDSTFRGRYPLCTFQAMSGETELASKVMFVDGWQLQKEVAIPFEVTASDSARPDFGFEFRLLAHGRLPFTFSSVTVHRTES